MTPMAETSEEKLAKVRQLHSRIAPLDAMVMLGSEPGVEYCAGCDCGDPYLAVEWPCETRRICDE